MQVFDCIVSDDEQPARELLEHFITSTPGLHHRGSFAKGTDVFNYLHTNKVDLLFLDIRMPGISGMEVISKLPDPPSFIITTAHHEFAVQAFDLNAVDYLTKPFSEERFKTSVAKFMRAHADQPARDQLLSVKVDRKAVQVPLKEIAYIKADGNYSRIIMVNKKMLITHATVGSLLDLLPGDEFIQVHRSYIVARNKIYSYTADSVIIGDVALPVGRSYRSILFRK
jgi:DNA-binding LytR/AlgR family response regulator